MTDKRLLSYLERIERLAAERVGISDDIRDVVTEATSAGYDAKTMRKLLALRGMDSDDRTESEFLLDTYKSAVGMAGPPETIGEDTRLGRAARLFRDKKTVKQVAALMGLGNGTAGRLRKTADALGMLSSHIPSQECGTGHDPETGEIQTSTAGSHLSPHAGNDTAVPSAPKSPVVETPAKPDDGDGGIRPATPAEVAAIQAAIDRRNAALTLPDHLRHL